jgi:hypothetical protein
MFKKIHPDLFAMETAHIRQGNMDCMQKMGEIVGVMDAYREMIKDARYDCYVTNPLQMQYTLKCYAHRTVDVTKNTPGPSPKEDTSEVKEQRKVIYQVGMVIKVPPLLTFKQKAERKDLQQAVALIRRKVNEFHVLLGVDVPWPVNNRSAGEDVDSEDREHYGMLTKEKIAADIYERVMIQDNNISSSAIFGSARSGLVAHKGNKQMVEGFIDLYIQRGRVLIKNMNAIEEQKALINIRKFFGFYGMYVNFTASNWRNVYVILVGPKVQDSFKHGATGPQEPKENKKLSPTSSPFKYELKGTHHILEVPFKYRGHELVSFIQQNVPNTLNIH